VWEYWIHDTQTGAPLVRILPSSAKWTRRLTGTGSGDLTLNLSDPDVIPREQVRDLLRANNRVVAVTWGEHVAFAGYITNVVYHRATRTVDVSLREIRGLLARRFTGPTSNYGTAWNLTITDRSPSGAVRAILSRVLTLFTAYNLPIDLPPDGAGTFDREVVRWETVTGEDLISEVEALGVTVDFRPYLTAGMLRWECTVDTLIDRGTTDFSVSAPESPVSTLDVTIDGTSQITGVIVVGKGTGADMRVAGVSDSAGGVAIAAKTEAKDIENQGVLGTIANATMTARKFPTEQWALTVRAGDDVTPAMVEPGRHLRLDIRDDPFIPDDQITKQVIALAGDTGLTLTPEVQ